MNAIFAVDEHGGFGTGSDMPWPRCKTDLDRFKHYTSGQTIIMGSGTWNSNMPKPLPNRRNIVLSSSLVDDRCEVYSSVDEIVSKVTDSTRAWVIGGAQVLWELRSWIKTIYLTRFYGIYPCSIVLDMPKYLDGYVLQDRQKLDTHRFDIWQKYATL